MGADRIKCDQCGGSAVVKAVLPEVDQASEPVRVRREMILVYCPRCGIRSQLGTRTDGN